MSILQIQAKLAHPFLFPARRPLLSCVRKDGSPARNFYLPGNDRFVLDMIIPLGTKVMPFGRLCQCHGGKYIPSPVVLNRCILRPDNDAC
jgi:hypothetical protein